jgi:hypothetical protein
MFLPKEMNLPAISRSCRTGRRTASGGHQQLLRHITRTEGNTIGRRGVTVGRQQ